MNDNRLDHPEPVQFEYRIDDYLSVLYKRRGIILFVAVAAALFSGLISSCIDSRYEARGVFYVPQDVHDATDIADLRARLPSGVQAHARTFAAVLEESNVRREVVKRLPEEKAEHFRVAINVSPTREGLIRVYARDRDPQLACDVVNMIIDIFNEFHQNVILGDLNTALNNINNKLNEVNKNVEDLTMARQRFREEHQIASLDVMIEELERKKADFEQMLYQSRSENKANEQRIQSMAEQLEEEADAYAKGEVILQDPVTELLQERLTLLEVEIAGQQVMLNPDHPYMVSLQHRYGQAKEALARHIHEVVSSKSKITGSLYDGLREDLVRYKVELCGTQARIEGLKQAIKVIEENVRKVPGLLAQLGQYEDQIMRQKNLRASLESAQDKLITSSLQLKTTGLVIERAAKPTRPVFPITILNVMIAGFIGLLTGILYVLVLEHLDSRKQMRLIRELSLKKWTDVMDDQGESI